MAGRKKKKHIKIESRVYVLFAFELDDKCKIIKTTRQRFKKCVLGLSWQPVVGWIEDLVICLRKLASSNTNST